MGLPAAPLPVSPEEYLALDRAAEAKHEYVDGEIFAMSGGTGAHSLIAMNIGAEIRGALQGRPCRVFNPDVRIAIRERKSYVYPDASVVCGKPQYTDPTCDTLLNPILVLEVLSDSSERYDRGDKFDRYRTLPSMKEYVLASQTEAKIEVFTRQADESWVLRVYRPGEKAMLPSLGCELSVDRAYLGVFDQDEEGAA